MQRLVARRSKSRAAYFGVLFVQLGAIAAVEIARITHFFIDRLSLYGRTRPYDESPADENELLYRGL